MSTYENYSDTSNSFDSTRAAVAYEIWLGHLLASGRPLDTLRLLDSGCGTGNYSTALAPYVGHITAMDMNKAMLAKAKEKLIDKQLADRVEVMKGSMLEMDLNDREYDAVLFNQVLHHLESGTDPAYGGHARALAEAHRVLRPGGLATINVCTHEQQHLIEHDAAFDAVMFNQYHALLVEMGKQHCRPTAQCGGCPLESYPHDESL